MIGRMSTDTGLFVLMSTVEPKLVRHDVMLLRVGLGSTKVVVGTERNWTDLPDGCGVDLDLIQSRIDRVLAQSAQRKGSVLHEYHRLVSSCSLSGRGTRPTVSADAPLDLNPFCRSSRELRMAMKGNT